jgi:hypothetical protein
MMKKLVMLLAGLSIGLVFGLTTASAKFQGSLIAQSPNSIVFEEMKCKEGEKYDEETKKCVADEGKK